MVSTVALLAQGIGLLIAPATNAFAFEGKIDIVITRGGESISLLYSLGEDSLRIEISGNTRPDPINIVDLKSDGITIVYPHNRSFVRLKSGGESTALTPPNTPPIPTPPPGIGAQPDKLPPGVSPMPQLPVGLPAGIGPRVSNAPGVPAMPPMRMETLELKATGKKEKILGYDCEQFEIKQRGETLEIWATDRLLPFQSYLNHEPRRLGPRMLEEEWPDLLKAKKLFPLRVSLHYDNTPDGTAGAERFHLEVKSITPEKIPDSEGKLFKPPENYVETQPPPF